MSVKSLAFTALFLGGAVMFASGPDAAEPSGTAVAVVQSASAEGAGGQRLLMVSASLFMGDRVRTGDIGEAQIRFRDQTKLVVGPNSSLLIDKFIFNPDKTAKAISINAIKGSFRWISGVSPKSAYSIQTPTATIGIRGTRFDLSVVNGVTNFALYEGGAKICKKGGGCVEVKGTCELVSVPAGQPIKKIAGGIERTNVLEQRFPYFRSQARLLPDFKVNTSGCALSKAQTIGPQQAPPTEVAEAPAPPPAPPADDNPCGGNCGKGKGNGGGNGTGNEGNGKGPGK
jgi:hypothetical protein